MEPTHSQVWTRTSGLRELHRGPAAWMYLINDILGARQPNKNQVPIQFPTPVTETFEATQPIHSAPLGGARGTSPAAFAENSKSSMHVTVHVTDWWFIN